MSELEKRLFVLGLVLTISAGVLTAALFGRWAALSFLAGGALGGVGLLWLKRTVDGLFLQDRKAANFRVGLGFLFRLLLIPATLYVMIRLVSLSAPAVIAGFAVFHSCIVIEGILEALGKLPR